MDQLKNFIEACPKEFKTDLLLKVNDFIDEDQKVFLGYNSHQYLKTELQTIAPNRLIKKIDPKKLAFQIESALFRFPSINHFNPSEYVPHQSINFRNGPSY